MSRYGGRIELLKELEFKGKRNKREKILGKKRKLERVENCKYCSYGRYSKEK